MPATTPRIICFDLGGVIVRICRSWGQACERAGVPEREPSRFAQPHLARERRRWAGRHQVGAVSCDEFFAGIAEATDGLYSAEEVRRVHHAWIIEDYPGVEGVIDRINAAPGVVSACLSNTNHAHWVGMLALPGGEGHRSPSVQRLEMLGASQLLRAAKPGADIYRHAEALFGARGPEIVFFDDLEENVSAARGLGWQAHRIDHEGDTAGQIQAELARLGVAI